MMDRSNQPTLVRRLKGAAESVRRPLSEASHVPYWIYSDSELLEYEKESLFFKDWLCVGREDQIPNPGDYLTRDIFGEPIVIARNSVGELHAFSNFCLHRGGEITTHGTGNATEFKCPYHSWLYDLDGRLMGAPHMRETADFRAKECVLPRVGLGTWAGFIFVNFDQNASPLPSFVEKFSSEFGFLRIGDCGLGSLIELNLDCNWKFVMENLFDIYHVTVIHKGTFGKYRDATDYFPTKQGQDGLFGYYSARPSVPGGVSLFGNMPWLADKPLDFACSGFQAPNIQMFARCDSVLVHTIWPVSVDKTRVLSYQLFPKEFFDDPEFDAKASQYSDFIKSIIAEDEGAILSLQRAANSRLFRSGRMSRLEHGVYNAINYYFDRILGEAAAS